METLRIQVPKGTTQHGDPRLLCPPTTWKSLIVFFIGNFVAHVATVKSTPGETLPVTICTSVLALLFPTSGLMRGLNAIARRVKLGKTKLDKACRAGALCVVVRNSAWRPKLHESLQVLISTPILPEFELREQGMNFEGTVKSAVVDVERNLEENSKLATFKVYQPTWLAENQRWWTYFDTIWGRATVNLNLFAIHGTYKLPQGYSFAILPRNSVVVPRTSKYDDSTQYYIPPMALTNPVSQSLAYAQGSDIASSGSLLKILASVFQLLFVYYTLYKHQGDQLERWGFVSLFLTPLPYALMSLTNGVSNLLTPDYTKIYMVHSEIMDEAEEAGGSFDGVVGRVIPLAGFKGDVGYRSGFASSWKGISPTSLKRVILEVWSSLQRKPAQSRAVTLSTVIAFSSKPSPICILKSQPGDFTPNTYEIHGDRLTTLNWTDMFENYRGVVKRSPLLRAMYWVSYPIRHPQRIANHIVTLSGNIRKLSRKTKACFWNRQKPMVNSMATSRESEGQVHKPSEHMPRQTIYYQSCPRFLRHDDPLSQQNLVAGIRNSAQTLIAPAIGGIASPGVCTPRLDNGIAWTSILLPTALGIILSSIPIAIVGVLSNFHPGRSSLTQRVIMLLWWSSGIVIGLFMPFLDLTEILVFILWWPLFVVERMERLSQAAESSLLVLVLQALYFSGHGGSTLFLSVAFIPWSVFIAPIWGFVLVGLMVREWGNCMSIF